MYRIYKIHAHTCANTHIIHTNINTYSHDEYIRAHAYTYKHAQTRTTNEHTRTRSSIGLKGMQLWLLTADLFVLAFTLVFFSLFYPAVPLVSETIVSEWDSTDVLGKTPFLSHGKITQVRRIGAPRLKCILIEWIDERDRVSNCITRAYRFVGRVEFRRFFGKKSTAKQYLVITYDIVWYFFHNPGFTRRNSIETIRRS